MAPRGLSAAEKKVKMLEIFHESKSFYTLKEMEKLGPKLKGITMQTVKETIEDLMGDGLVNFDKIGTSNYYWAFPSAAGAAVSLPPSSVPLLYKRPEADFQKQAAVDRADKELEGVQARIAQVKIALAAAQKGKEETAERQQLLVSLNNAKEANASLKAELSAYGATDPVKYERKKRAIEVCKESALRWTDNSVTAMQFGKNTFQMEDEAIKEITGIGQLLFSRRLRRIEADVVADIEAWEDIKMD